MNAPVLLYFLALGAARRAPTSRVMAHHGFHGGMAMAMLLFACARGRPRSIPSSGTIVETRFAT